MNDVSYFLAGVFVTVLILIFVVHVDESICQVEHNVADCTQVFVPVTR
jgi:hypothetical protein